MWFPDIFPFLFTSFLFPLFYFALLFSLSLCFLSFPLFFSVLSGNVQGLAHQIEGAWLL